jgi:hypothetical protein
LTLEYPGFEALLDVDVREDGVRLCAQVTRTKALEAPPEPVHLQLPFLMKGQGNVVTGTGTERELDLQDEIMPGELGAMLGRKGKWRIEGLEVARALLLVLPYNTHWRNGWAHDEKAMGIVAQPLSYGAPRHLTVHGPEK